MSVKKPPIEERMALSIYNSLQVLVKSNKTTVEFQKILTKTMFIKSNTQAFIHVSHFLFTLFDAKEFKRRFYWPIHDKSAENSYRTTSVEYINDLIEKHSLKTDKIKAVNVVHPGGLKFQHMLHIIIQLVLKKELTRFTNKSPKTLDIHEVKLQYSNRKTVEINLIQTVTSNMEVIKNKTISINQLIDDVFDSDHQKEIDFICNWNNFNKKRLQDIKLRKTRITNVKMECSAMFHHAKKLLTSKKRQITTQYNESINELFEFFQNQFLENSLQIECSLGINDRVNYECLVQLLHAMIPFINNYIKNFSYGGAETIPYEKRVISKFCSEMKELYSEISAFSRRYEMDSVSSLKNSSIRSLLNEDDIQIKPYIVNTPSSKFDFTEMCINLGKFNGNRLTLIGEDQENPLNRTKLFRMQQLTPKSSNKNSIYSAENTMVAPVPLMNKGAIRKRRDPLAILEKATQSKTQTQQNKRNEYNTNYQLSSTMLSPAEGRLNRENPDFSRISSISSIKISPVIPDDFTYRNNYENQNNNKFLSTIIQHQHKNQNTSPLAFKHMLPEVKLFETTPKSSPVSSNYKRKGINPVNFLQCPPSGSHIQMSPTGKLDSLVSHGDILPPPKLFLNNSSFATDLEQFPYDDLTTSVSETQDVTILMNSDYVDDDVNSSDTIVPKKKPSLMVSDFENKDFNNDDEMLFNVSDSVLCELNFDTP